jgi:hypothetical protein
MRPTAQRLNGPNAISIRRRVLSKCSKVLRINLPDSERCTFIFFQVNYMMTAELVFLHIYVFIYIFN